MLINAKDQPLSQVTTGLPDVSRAVARLLQPVTFEYMQRTLVEGRMQAIPIKVQTQASKQPFTAQMLKVKPEGDRAWSWYWIHSLINLEVQINDRIRFNGMAFKIMEKLNYREYGYFEYHAILDVQGNK